MGSNVLLNAIRHSPDGTTVHLNAQIADASLIVKVVDTGPGIAPDDLPKIFDRFHKGRGSSGTGIGLTIARTLIRAHGGDISAASHPGAGTTMTVTLPVG